jgi:hypothetical protein
MGDPAGRLDPKNWPGTDGGGKEVSVHKDQVKQIIRALQADRDRYDNASEGTPTDLEGRGRIKDPKILGGGPDDKTGYPAGRTLNTYLTNASTHLPQAYRSFLTAYDALIKSLGDQTGAYDKTEGANQGSLPSTGTTGYYGSGNPNT